MTRSIRESARPFFHAGFSPADGSAVLTTPSTSPVINYWSNEDYLAFGHYTGAANVPVIALAGDLIKTIDPSKEVLVYCYTGQTSSIATFWLNVLGYKTKGISFGANRMVYSPLKTAKKATYPGAKNWAVTTN